MPREPRDEVHELTRACAALRAEIDGLNVRVDRMNAMLRAHLETEPGPPLTPELDAALARLRSAVVELLEVVALARGTA